MAAAVHPRRLVLFGLLSALDLGLTWLLVRHGGGAVYESNPVAGWWLAAYGWAGLAAFKAASVTVVIGLVVLVSRFRPRAGGRILGFGCAAVAGVVLYSGYLAAVGVPSPEEDLSGLAESDARLEVQMDRAEEYHRLLERQCADLGAGRCRLAEALARLDAASKAHDPDWLRHLRDRYGVASDAECLAVNLIVNSLAPLHQDPAAADRLARRLDRDFRATFGGARPGPYRAWLSLAGFDQRPPALKRQS